MIKNNCARARTFFRRGAITSTPLAFAIVAMLIASNLFAAPRDANAAGEATSILEGNHPDEAADIASKGNAPVSRQLKVRVILALNHRKDLERLLADQQNPS